eukprot:5193160-Prymnesium_polylepis.1
MPEALSHARVRLPMYGVRARAGMATCTTTSSSSGSTTRWASRSPEGPTPGARACARARAPLIPDPERALTPHTTSLSTPLQHCARVFPCRGRNGRAAFPYVPAVGQGDESAVASAKSR